MKEDFIEHMKQSNLDLKQYLSIIGKNEEDMIKDLASDAKKSIIEIITIDSILEKENVLISNDEIEKVCDSIVKEYNTKKDKINKNFVVNKIKNNKIRELLLKLNKYE